MNSTYQSFLDSRKLSETDANDEPEFEYNDLLNKGLSNSWAVHGNFTDSGNPLMANDFHMGADLPMPVTLGELRWGENGENYVFGA